MQRVTCGRTSEVVGNTFNSRHNRIMRIVSLVNFFIRVGLLSCSKDGKSRLEISKRRSERYNRMSLNRISSGRLIIERKFSYISLHNRSSFFFLLLIRYKSHSSVAFVQICFSQ